MTIRTVKKEIQKALANDPPVIGCSSGKHISGSEGQRIVREAEKGYVSTGEAKIVGDIFNRELKPTPPGSMVTMACPENPGAVGFDPSARKAFNTFFVKHDLPYGENTASVKGRIQSTIADVGYGEPMSKAPSIKHLHHVFIRDSRPVDGDRVDAFVDSRKGAFYIKSTGAGMAGPHTIGPNWYGPIDLPDAAKPEGPNVTDATRQRLLQSFENAGTLDWQFSGAPIGVKYTRVPLKSDGYTDGFTYTALIASGAVAPGAEPKDPNKAKSFFVERSGGFAGITQVAGPIKVGAVEPKPELPAGIEKLQLTATSSFGALASFANLSGAVTNNNWVVNVGTPKVDEGSKTIDIPISAVESGEVFYTSDAPEPFNRMVPLNAIAGKSGSWKINVTDCDGNLLRSTQLEQFSPC